MAELTEELRARLARLLAENVTEAEHAPRGYTPAGRWLLRLQSGRTAFAKVGATPLTAEFLRAEAKTYETLRGRFMPQLLAWEDAAQPILVLEDLRAAEWPPPWTQSLVNEVRATLEELHGTSAPLSSFAELHGDLADGWQQVESVPAAFLALGLASQSWLERALPSLLQAAAAVQTAGNEVLHLDVRSDNLCRADRGVVLIDWNHACLGNGALDTGFWLPSLEAEGGPPPEETLPGSPEIAAWVSGFFAARAGLPQIPDAPRVRAVQLQQLGPALRWAARALALPLPHSA